MHQKHTVIGIRFEQPPIQDRSLGETTRMPAALGEPAHKPLALRIHKQSFLID